jgi:hypothetical protein
MGKRLRSSPDASHRDERGDVRASRGGLILSDRCCFAASHVIHELATCSALRIRAEESSRGATLPFPIPVISCRQLIGVGSAPLGRRRRERRLLRGALGQHRRNPATTGHWVQGPLSAPLIDADVMGWVARVVD